MSRSWPFFQVLFQALEWNRGYWTSGEGDRFNSRRRKKANKQRKLVVSSFGCGVVVVEEFLPVNERYQ